MKALVSNRFLSTRILNLILGKSFGVGAIITDVPKPSISENEILVKVRAAALNPTDYKHIDVISPPYSIIGCDFAGEVVEVGKDALGGWKEGDRVAGAVHGGLYQDRGAFAEYLKIDGDLAWKIPAEVSDEQATTYGVSASTAMLALNLHLGLPRPGQVNSTQNQNTSTSNVPPTILIYAGSTSVGLFAIQRAKKAGYTVVTTASPRSFDLVRRFGADGVFDYRSPTASEEITKAYPDITQAMDCISEGHSTSFCAQVLKNRGGKVVVLLDRGKSTTPGVEYDLIMLYTVFGRDFAWLQPVGPKFPAKPSDREHYARFIESLPALAKEYQTPPITIIDGGIPSIVGGLDQLRQGKVSGGKLVVRM